MDFFLHYFWPSIKVCFIGMLKWVTVITIVISEYIAVLTLSWGILLFPVFVAIDIAIIRAYGNYQDDKERAEQGLIPKYRDK